MRSIGITQTLQEMREEFDRSFSVPIASAVPDSTSILIVRTPLAACALRVNDLEAIEPCRSLTPLPGLPPGALGMTGFRGRVISAYDLGHFIHSSREAARAPRWFAIIRDPEPIALGIADSFYYRVVRREQISPLPAGFRPVPHGDESVSLENEQIFVLNLKAVISAIRRSDAS